MARIVPSTLTFTEKRWFTALIKKYQMRPIWLRKRKLPYTMPKEWRGLYLEDQAKDYIPKLKPSPGMNAIGWHNGELVFIYLRGQNGIGPEIQKRAFDELEMIDFTPCKKSARVELQNAARYSPLASEWNPGHRLDSYHGNEIVVAKDGLTNDYPDVEKLIQCMWKMFRNTLPKHWAQAHTLCPEPFRIAGTGFTRLAVLKSAASAIHTDDGNGPGFAAMTTLRGWPPYKGGTFCFMEFGQLISVKAGDILIANTPKFWHCNVGEIEGLKYSVVAYFKRTLGTSKPIIAKHRAKTGMKYSTRMDRDELFASRSRSVREGNVNRGRRKVSLHTSH